MSYQPRWFCKDCGDSGYLPHNIIWFAPDVCPGCGREAIDRWKGDQFRSIPAKLAHRPKGLNIFRHVWVDSNGEEITVALAKRKEHS